MTETETIGIIGGNGQLGGAIARALLRGGVAAPERIWISSRSGRVEGFDAWPELRLTRSNQELVDACSIVILSVPPAATAEMRLDAANRLVISVMAGVTMQRLGDMTGSDRVIRAMSSPVAEVALAYSPWVASAAVTSADRTATRVIFEACGATDEIGDETNIDHFTALTGPVPGFVALLADCMIDYAEKHGIDPAIAERAIRQLFSASGDVLGRQASRPADQVKAMVDYAGTTAAGIEAMEDAGLRHVIATGLDAAVARARTIAG